MLPKKNNGQCQEGFERSLLETKDRAHDGSTICNSIVASLDRTIHRFYLLGSKSKIQSGKQSRWRNHNAGECAVAVYMLRRCIRRCTERASGDTTIHASQAPPEVIAAGGRPDFIVQAVRIKPKRYIISELDCAIINRCVDIYPQSTISNWKKWWIRHFRSRSIIVGGQAGPGRLLSSGLQRRRGLLSLRKLILSNRSPGPRMRTEQEQEKRRVSVAAPRVTASGET